MTAARYFVVDGRDWESELGDLLSTPRSGGIEEDTTVGALRRWATDRRADGGTLVLNGLPGEGIGTLAYELARGWLERTRETGESAEVWYSDCESGLAGVPPTEPGIARLEILDERRADDLSDVQAATTGRLRLVLSESAFTDERFQQMVTHGLSRDDAASRLVAFARSMDGWLPREVAAAALEPLVLWRGNRLWTGGRRCRVLVELAQESWRHAFPGPTGSPEAAREFAAAALRSFEEYLRGEIAKGAEPLRQVVEVCSLIAVTSARGDAQGGAASLDWDLVSGVLYDLHHIVLSEQARLFPHLLRKEASSASPSVDSLEVVSSLVWRLGRRGTRGAGTEDAPLLAAIANVARKRRSFAGARFLWSLGRAREALDVVFAEPAPDRDDWLRPLWCAPTGPTALSDLSRWEQRLRDSVQLCTAAVERSALSREADAARLLRSASDAEVSSHLAASTPEHADTSLAAGYPHPTVTHGTADHSLLVATGLCAERIRHQVEPTSVFARISRVIIAC